ncbi:MAG: ribonuclease HII [Chloroflexi bacterium]|nr:ribonuclease HII [Chloroflexota bacterium]
MGKSSGKTNIEAGKTGPTLLEERALVASGLHRLAGVDEAGRGAWAGPLVAAAAVLTLPEQAEDLAGWQELAARLKGVNDSKQVTPAGRERLFELVLREAEVGVGLVSSLTVDLIGVGAANKLAMARAVAALPQPPEHLLIDAFKLPQVALPQTALIKGDARCFSIAAASIIAKVTRDRLLVELDTTFPGYGFAKHKGYGTALHAAALAQYGPCAIHRYSYIPVWEVFEQQRQAL